MARYVNWEQIQLTNRSQLTFSSTLTLGDVGTGTGTLTIDPTSKYSRERNTRNRAFHYRTTCHRHQRRNHRSPNGGVTDSLRITGNYVGDSGIGRLDTFLPPTIRPPTCSSWTVELRQVRPISFLMMRVAEATGPLATASSSSRRSTAPRPTTNVHGVRGRRTLRISAVRGRKRARRTIGICVRT